MEAEVLSKLEIARKVAGVPFVINSGLRCRVHNKHVGGSPSSSHIDGLAADIKTEDNNHRYLIIKGLIAAGFKRIGIAKSFIHVDCDKSKPQELTWVYK